MKLVLKKLKAAYTCSTSVLESDALVTLSDKPHALFKYFLYSMEWNSVLFESSLNMEGATEKVYKSALSETNSS